MDVIACDESIYNTLRSKLHKSLLKKKKIPYPVPVWEISRKRKDGEEIFKKLISSVYFLRGNGPFFEIEGCRVRMSDKMCVKNIINLVYDFIPQILLESPKDTSIAKVSLYLGKSKELEIFRNDFIPDTEETIIKTERFKEE